MSDLERRLAEIEARLRRTEDELGILRLLNSYGPLVDSGAAAEAAALWRAGGGYEFGDASGARRAQAPAGLVELYESDFHRRFVQTGSAHVTATPQIIVDGDRATAVGYSFVIVRGDGCWNVARAAINRWLLVRSPAGWRIDERINRVLDGSSESHELMHMVLDG